MRLLIENGADINAGNSDNMSSLLIPAILGGIQKKIQIFFTKEALIQIFYVYCLGYEKVAELLIEKGADVNSKLDLLGITALRLAIDRGKTQIVDQINS